MKINLKMLPKKELLHLFDSASKTHKGFLAVQIVKELAKKNHLTIDYQLRKLGQRAIKRKCVTSFQMVNNLWRGKEK